MKPWKPNARSAWTLGGDAKTTAISRGTAQPTIPPPATAAVPALHARPAIPATKIIGQRCPRDTRRSWKSGLGGIEAGKHGGISRPQECSAQGDHIPQSGDFHAERRT